MAGRGTRKGAVKKRSQRQNQNDGTEALDKAQPRKRRIYVAKEAWHEEI
jgi:hypothetical protein